MSFEIHIHPGSAAPIFKQIVDQVRIAVVTGSLGEGDQLPSVRALAERLLVNPNTIAKAYAELTREGVLDGQKGRGLFVTRLRQMYTRSERLRRMEPLVEAIVNEGIALGFGRSDLVDLVEARCVKLGLSDREKGK